MKPLSVMVAAGAALLLGGGLWFGLTPPRKAEVWLGYAEADYVKVAPTQQGMLTSLSVARGDSVDRGAALFTQDDIDDRALRDQAAADLAQAQEKLADLQGRGRDPEILQARADLVDMQASYERVARDLARGEAELESGSVSQQSVDQLRADTRSARARVDSARARLALISLPSGRDHALAAQRAAVTSASFALRAAEWRLAQRTVVAPVAGRVADSYARPGEVIAAGGAVVSLLPPENIFVRFFVPESALPRLHAGDRVGIGCDSCPTGLQASVRFIATSAEYTPPVIYSGNARSSLVYLIEARPDAALLPWLKPGQPVDVRPVLPSSPSP